MSALQIRAFPRATFTVSYLVWDRQTKRAAIIDSVLDFDRNRAAPAPRPGRADAVREEGVTVDWLLETHAHADHLSAAPFLKQHLNAPIVIGEHIKAVQKVFRACSI